MSDPEPLADLEPVSEQQARLDVIDAVGMILTAREAGELDRDLVLNLTADFQPEHLIAAVDMLCGLSVASKLGAAYWITFRQSIEPMDDETFASMDDRGVDDRGPSDGDGGPTGDGDADLVREAAAVTPAAVDTEPFQLSPELQRVIAETLGPPTVSGGGNA
jgi:hypothetical protein